MPTGGANFLAVSGPAFRELITKNEQNNWVHGDPAMRFIDIKPAINNVGAPQTISAVDFPFLAEVELKLTGSGSITQSMINQSVNATAAVRLNTVGSTSFQDGADPTKSPQAQRIRLNVGLRKTVLALVATQEQFDQNEFAEGRLADVIALHAEDLISKKNDWLATCFYQDGTGALASVKTAPGTIATGAITAIVVNKGSARRFQVGDRLIAYAGPGTWPGTKTALLNAASAAAPLLVTGVAGDIDTIYVTTSTASNYITIIAGSILSKEGTVSGNTSLMPDGLEALIKSATTDFFYGFALSSYPELRGQRVDGDYNNPEAPTPNLVTDLLDSMFMTSNHQSTPNLIISSAGIISKYAFIQGAQATWNWPSGMGQSPDGGFAMPGVSYPSDQGGQMKYMLIRSTHCDQQAIYGVDTSKWVGWMPGGGAIRYLTPTGDSANPWYTIPNASNPAILTFGKAVSAYMYYQLVCNDPRSSFFRGGVARQKD